MDDIHAHYLQDWFALRTSHYIYFTVALPPVTPRGLFVQARAWQAANSEGIMRATCLGTLLML